MTTLTHQQAIYYALTEQRGRRSHELATMLDIPHRRVLAALRALEAGGAIERVGRNWYPKP